MKKSFNSEQINGRNFQFLALPGTDVFKFEIINTHGAYVERAIAEASNNETELYGIAHLIEHLGFRCTKDYTTDELNTIIKNEGEYNASTNHHRINYWFKTDTSRLELAIKVVCNYALNDLTKLTQEEFETERKVVCNEINKYGDDHQSMFWFNLENVICNGNVVDNILGDSEKLKNFTLENVIDVKKAMLRDGETFYNVTYDPEKQSTEDIVRLIEAELVRFEGGEIDDTAELHIFDHLPKMGQTISVPSESEQKIVGVVVDVVRNDDVAMEVALKYLSQLAKTSLNQVIREDNGLTYSTHFHNTNIRRNKYVIFGCDVTVGDEDKLMELFVQSINESSELFNEECYEKTIRKMDLDRTLADINPLNSSYIFWQNIVDPGKYAKHSDLYAEDMNKGRDEMMKELRTFEGVQECISRIRRHVNGSNWIRVITK